MTEEQLADVSYVLHALLGELQQFVHHNPESLQVSVGQGPWQELGHPLGQVDELAARRRLGAVHPELSLDEVAQLEEHLFDVGPGDVAHGDALVEVIDQHAPWRSWLEAAVLAGYVPHAEGIELCLRGLFLFTRARAEEEVARGLLGDAEGWLAFSRRYRDLAGLLCVAADELEARRAELGLEPLS